MLETFILAMYFVTGIDNPFPFSVVLRIVIPIATYFQDISAVRWVACSAPEQQDRLLDHSVQCSQFGVRIFAKYP